MFRPCLAFLERFGAVLGRTLLTVIYLVAVFPVAAFYRLFADPLGIRAEPESNYHPWTGVNETLEDARRQD